MSDVRSLKSDLSCEISNVRCQRSDVGCEMLDVKCQMSDANYPCQMSDEKRWMSDVKVKILYEPVQVCILIWWL